VELEGPSLKGQFLPTAYLPMPGSRPNNRAAQIAAGRENNSAKPPVQPLAQPALNVLSLLLDADLL